MRTLYLLSVWIHILSAIVWIGGMVFLALVVVPVTRRTELRGQSGALFRWTGRRFRWIGWICLLLFVLTGIVNLAYRGYHWSDLWSGALWSGSFGQTLAVKLVLVAAILVLSAVHDFKVGPEAASLMEREPTANETRRWRRAASWFGRVNLLLALIVVMLGVMLVRGGW